MALFEKGHIPWHKGKKLSDEHKKKLSKSHIGKKTWNTGIKGLPSPMEGKHHSKKSKLKMSVRHKGQIAWNKGLKGRHFSPKTEFKKGEKRISGKNNHLWKGGITPLNKKIRTSSEYKEWRKQVFERDNFECQECGEKGYLNAHHLIPFRKQRENFDVENGITLCPDCHWHMEGIQKMVGDFYE